MAQDQRGTDGDDAQDKDASGKSGEDQAPPKGEAHGGEVEKQPGPLKNPLVLAGAAVVAVIVVVGVLLWWSEARRWQSTDDAYVDGHIVHLAPQISGIVVKVYVTDNAVVRAGQPLADIDASSFRAQAEQTRAQTAQVAAQISQQRAQIATAQANWQQARADAAGAAAQAEAAANDLRRYQHLHALAPQAVSAQQLDQALASARNTAAARDSALKKAAGAAQQIRAARAQVGALQAQANAAAAQLAQSQITLGDTRIYAPVDGHVAHLNVAPGGYVTPGQELMAIVPANLWITANFKETQLALMRVGQRADVKIDACSVSPLRAHVDSIQRGAGQAFALLPPENATGNFVKVVQRVPVKIVFDRVPQDCPIGPGLSVEPKVLVRP
ncbi:MAG TPA: HlyD family secretion protein [Caulobacteraceae bacterium]|jgi:membrane fusion protein (multidrug efflux system)